MNPLIEKERNAIKFIRNSYSLACDMSDNGFHVAFSGGKDSQTLLALMEESGCKYQAHMQITSVDPPQLMKFIRHNYPNVVLHRPITNMKNLIIKHGMLPMRQARFCCAKLKEQAGSGTCTCVGVRAAESPRRKKRSDVEVSGMKGIGFDIQGCELHQQNNTFDLFEVKTDTIVTCVSGNDKIIISPIFKWRDSDVWNFIRGNNIDFCELYKMGFHRIGCLFCPMASAKEKAREYRLFPRFAEKVYIDAIRELMETRGRYSEFDSAEDVFFWWISNKNRDEWLSNNRMKKLF